MFVETFTLEERIGDISILWQINRSFSFQQTPPRQEWRARTFQNCFPCGYSLDVCLLSADGHQLTMVQLKMAQLKLFPLYDAKFYTRSVETML